MIQYIHPVAGFGNDLPWSCGNHIHKTNYLKIHGGYRKALTE